MFETKSVFGGNSITRGKTIWQLAKANNAQPKRVTRRVNTKCKRVALL